MFITYAIPILIIFGLLAGWIGVQYIARAFATRHPEFGPPREDGEGCGGFFCICKNKADCSRRKFKEPGIDEEATIAPIIPLENTNSNSKE